MGFFGPSEKAEKLVGGDKLLAVLPLNPKPWYLTSHLLKLNLLLLVPFCSPAAVGFDGSMMNGLQTLTEWQKFFNTPSAPILGTINAMYPVGKVFGVFASAFLGDRYGRKVAWVVGLFFLLVGTAIQGAAQIPAMFIVSRLIIGFGISFLIQTSPILISELAYPTHRGRISGMYYCTYYLGAIVAAWTTYRTFRIPSNWSWRIPSIIQAAMPLMQLCFLWVVPESPTYAPSYKLISGIENGNSTDLPDVLGLCGLDLKRQRHPIWIKIALPSKQSANRTKRRADLFGLIAVLLHEMIHAYFQISAKLHAKDRNKRKLIKDIRILGPGGHGVYFQRIADVLERFVQDDLQLPIDMDRAKDFGFDLASCSDNLQYRSYYRALIRDLGLSRKEVEKVKESFIERRLSNPF